MRSARRFAALGVRGARSLGQARHGGERDHGSRRGQRQPHDAASMSVAAGQLDANGIQKQL